MRDGMGGSKAAVYHFTDGSQKRPIVYQKELERLKEFAHNAGYNEVDVFVDKTLRKSDQIQLELLMENVQAYKALILKDFYHLRKNTGSCMSELVRLSRAGIGIHTLEDGGFRFTEPPLGQKRDIAVYYCGLEITERSLALQYDIMDLFIKEKTNWNLLHRYADLDGNKADGNQKELQQLIRDKDQYDIVLVRSFGDIHWRTSKFTKIRHLVQKGIYSMHDEIYLPYEMEGKKYDV